MPDTIQLLQIAFFLNDREVRVIVPPDRTALEVIRGELGLTGTKETCSEGDCGACTVALGELADELLVYRAVNSCILPAARLHGRHVITVEGLAAGGQLHVIQQQLLDHHAVQCGFCTPGIVMSLFCLFLQRPDPDEAAILGRSRGTCPLHRLRHHPRRRPRRGRAPRRRRRRLERSGPARLCRRHGAPPPDVRPNRCAPRTRPTPTAALWPATTCRRACGSCGGPWHGSAIRRGHDSSTAAPT